MVRTTGILSGDLSDFDDMFDDDDLLDSGNYSARPQQLSSETFDADAFQSLDLDVTSGTVEVKCVSGGPVRVIESGRVAKGTSASDAATRNLAEVKGSTLKISQFDYDDKRAIDRCKELFPIDVLLFKGKEFKRGMQIRITTIQQNVIVGEFIGLNRVNLVCIKTGNKIIAHQLEKIAEVTKAE